MEVKQQASRSYREHEFFDPVIEVYKRDVDRTLLRANLQLTPEERLRKLQELQRFAAELRRAGRALRGG